VVRRARQGKSACRHRLLRRPIANEATESTYQGTWMGGAVRAFVVAGATAAELQQVFLLFHTFPQTPGVVTTLPSRMSSLDWPTRPISARRLWSCWTNGSTKARRRCSLAALWTSVRWARSRRTWAQRCAPTKRNSLQFEVHANNNGPDCSGPSSFCLCFCRSNAIESRACSPPSSQEAARPSGFPASVLCDRPRN
jgi:hypothetical protein